MNKIIKLRAFDPIQKEMIYQDKVYPYTLITQYGLFRHEPATMGKNYNRIDRDFALMQFTGLLDNYHKDIYDGDLLKSGQRNIFKVIWDDNEAGWVLDCLTGDNKGLCELKKYMEENLEVIGNIYEHSDLLKKG